MTKIDMLNLGIYGTNCYLIRSDDSTGCAVIDPGGDGAKALEKAKELGLTVEAILLTHGHFDHVGGVKELQSLAQCPVYLHGADLSLPQALTAGPLNPTDLLEEGDSLNLAGLTIQVLHTPGHTPGSVCFLTDDALFVGDTLFARSCGRTDLPGGDPASMTASLKSLGNLPYDGPAYPGHGPHTTLKAERAQNPYLLEAMAE